MINIVMGYLNRRPQLVQTLGSINRSSVKDKIELIIVDDGSSGDHRLDDVIGDYDFAIKLIKIPPAAKVYPSSIIAYNLALTHVTHDWVIIQNPEVCHIGDIPAFVLTCDPQIYYAFHVYALAEPAQLDYDFDSVESRISSLRGIWYCHPAHRPVPFHFCTAIHSSKLRLVGGFDSRLKDGVNYEDSDLVRRIKKVCDVQFVEEDLMAIHQYHPVTPHHLNSEYDKRNLAMFLQCKNEDTTYADPTLCLPPEEQLEIIYNR